MKNRDFQYLANHVRDLVQRVFQPVDARRLVEERYNWDAIGARFVTLVEEAVTQRR